MLNFMSMVYIGGTFCTQLRLQFYAVLVLMSWPEAINVLSRKFSDIAS